MRVAVFSSKEYDRASLEGASGGRHELVFFDAALDERTAVLAKDCRAVCVFVNDRLDEATLSQLRDGGVRLVALRCAGYNNVDLAAAKRLGFAVVRVPAYSPDAVAEHAVALVLCLARHIHRAYSRVRDGNFALAGLMGFNLQGKTVGVVGTGEIGATFARLMQGFGCEVVAVDPVENWELKARGIRYVTLPELLSASDILSLHCPLTDDTRHLIDATALSLVKPTLVLINTSRGAVLDTGAVIAALKQGRIGSLGLDVYEEEDGLFFEDRSAAILQDDVFARLLTFPNVLVTGHQGFLTHEAMAAIAQTTITSFDRFEEAGTTAANVTVVAGRVGGEATPAGPATD